MTSRSTFERALLFGGSGFIGTHLARHLLEQGLARYVHLADIQAPRRELQSFGSRLMYTKTDVRRDIPLELSRTAPDLIVNLAAVHREPGHEPHEYFETNVRGAEHVTRYAAAVGCNTLVFTSSISVYGPTEIEKDETSLPVPVSPYGASKLVAEMIHHAWQRAHTGRQLVVVRPGVVFGPGEGGNVTRLVRAVRAGYFVYCGNRGVRKAGGYVKELCNTVLWSLTELEHRGLHTLTFNFSMDPTPSLEEFVAAIAEVADKRVPNLSVPFYPILAASHVVQLASRIANVSQPLHPMRVHKLVRSNHICSLRLREYGYSPQFTLISALRDWRTACPADWGRD